MKKNENEIDERGGRPSASEMGRLMACPASWALSLDVERDGTTIASAKGDKIHKAIETGKLEDLDVGEYNTAKMITEIELFWLQSLGYDASNCELVREQRIWFGEEFSGKPDLLVIDKTTKRICIIDYKTGYKEVPEAKDNWQMKSLAVLVMDYYDLSSIDMIIIAPNNVKKSSHYKVYPLELFDWQKQLFALLSKIGKVTEPVVGTQCAYCPAKIKCSSYIFRGESAVMQIYDKQMPIDIAERLNVCVIAQERIDAERDAAKEILNNGGSIEGWKLKSTGFSKIIDLELAESIANREFKDLDYMVFSLKKLEQELIKKLGKKEALELIERVMAEAFTKKEKEKALVKNER